jgi:hypothetical protein
MNKNKKVIKREKIENAHRGARMIWEQLITLYLDNTSFRKLVEEDKMDKLWDLVNDERLNKYERICLLYTFDYALIDRENIEELVEALKSMHISENYDGLFEQASIIENVFKNNKDIYYLGANHNSVSTNFWEDKKDIDKSWLIFQEECLDIKIDDNKRKIIDKHNKAIIKLFKIKKELIKANYEIDVKPIDFEYLINKISIEIEAIKLRRDFLIKPKEDK